MKDEVNKLAWEEEDYDLSVSMEFTYNGENYKFTRQRRARSVSSEPKSDLDYIPSISLVKSNVNGNETIDTLLAETMIENIIPKKISEFILFDGESIHKYEELLDKNNNTEIYGSIKRILGVTTLENSKSNLEKYLDNLKEEKNDLAKKQTKNKKIQETLDKNKMKITELTKLLNEAETEWNKAIQEKDKYNEQLEANNAVNNLLRARERDEGQLEMLYETMDNDMSEVKDFLRKYESICYEFIDNEIRRDKSTEILEIEEKISKNKKIEEHISNLINNKNRKKCDYCEHEITDIEKKRIDDKIRDLKQNKVIVSVSEIEEIRKYNLRNETLNAILSNVEKINIKDFLNIKDKNIRKALNSEGKIKKQIRSITEQISNFNVNESEIKNLGELLIMAEKKVALYKENVMKNREQIDSLRKESDSLVKNMPQTPETASIDKRIIKVENLISILDFSIKKYANQTRIKVQNDATEMFRKIRTDEDYDRLEIDESYGLKIIDRWNNVVPYPSTGYTVIIAVALIYGLHKNSSLTGTIVLDAPFSNLTNIHRENMIKTFSDLSPQVILLAYKDQINMNSIEREMNDKLLKKIEIYQDSDEKKSIYKTKIREVK
ncbi:hypothetical protein [Mycoplasmopsis agassizii]|uniref:hypothetical protein n=1 Tax=Mycoplasmopsis agassizii TaxID=33922 RepID=UPI0035298104